MDRVASMYPPGLFEQILNENKLLKTKNASLKEQLEEYRNEVLKLQKHLHKFTQTIFGKKDERHIANPGQPAAEAAILDFFWNVKLNPSQAPPSALLTP